MASMFGLLPWHQRGDTRGSAVALWALALSCAACWHDWDHYEVPESNETPGQLCSDLCYAHEYCIRELPDCVANCGTQVINCSNAQMIELRKCVDDLDDCEVPAVAETVWNACLLGVGCYTTP